MKRILVIPYTVLLLLILSTTGCTSPSKDANQLIEPLNSNNSEEMIFDENEIDSEVSAEEMIFGEEEGILLTDNNTPPEGTWLWTNSLPIYEGCPVEFSNVVPPPDPPLQAEITIFTIGFQAIGYLCAMAVANIFYFLGPICELIFKPKNVENYRNLSYKSGLYFSVCLPLLIPCIQKSLLTN